MDRQIMAMLIIQGTLEPRKTDVNKRTQDREKEHAKTRFVT